MDDTEVAEPSSAAEADRKYLSVRQAAFIGVGAMVGAGIFALLGAAGEVAGAAVWLSFLLAGIVAALFATAGATNAGLYPAQGLSERLAETGQFPPLMARKLGGRASAGLLIAAAVTLVLALGFNLDAIASIGSAVALVIFTMITAAHLRIRAETGAKLPVPVLAIVAAGAVFVTFVFTTLVHEPASIVTLLVILVLSIGLDYGGKRSRPSRPVPVHVGP